MPTLYMQTTKIEPKKTAGEIQELLAEAGAMQTVVDYVNKAPRALTFGYPPRRRRSWWQRRMCSTSTAHAERDLAQAERVAWRQVLRWLQAQLAMIDTGMVEPVEVFMPYATLANGATMYEQLVATKFKALPNLEG